VSRKLPRRQRYRNLWHGVLEHDELRALLGWLRPRGAGASLPVKPAVTDAFEIVDRRLCSRHHDEISAFDVSGRPA
jgi:hypothetical protein